MEAGSGPFCSLLIAQTCQREQLSMGTDLSPLTVECIQEHDCIHLQEVSFPVTGSLPNSHLEGGGQVPVLMGKILV